MTPVPLPVAPKRAGVVLGQRASLAVSIGVAAHTFWSSAAPTLTYRLYAQEWHLTHTATTGIFAVYPVAVVAMLVGFGGISDQIGRRAAMLLSLSASLIGTLLFALAADVCWLFVGRAFMGIGVGLASGPSTAAILEFSGHQDAKRAAIITMTAQAGGFASALLVGGALTEYGPWPMRLCFWVFAVLLTALTIAAWFLPRRMVGCGKGAWRPRMAFVPKESRRAFATASAAMITAYTFSVLMLSLGGQVEHDLIGSSNALVNGAALTLFPLVLGPVGIVAKALSSRLALSIGSLAPILGMALLDLAVRRHDLLLYLVGTGATGVAYSLLFVGSLGLVNAAGGSEHRGAVFSALYLVAYLSMGALALVLGIVATAWGLGLAVDLGAAVIALISIATLGFAIGMREEGTRLDEPTNDGDR
ncbi:Predicted arabinose efflux permease, MFS family [Bradyrhizobium lablabi]|uniref:Predicted arabinose efflux permease, MFS family n=2 Tax=Bradyrhizobium TaxID=374 RepID=A0ABY0PEV1_9BRAD|nr:Predicted arabinose efflux permease, MFS family [Bradyrhizobium ottawaense]SED75208.1 Predicted arabinose efflux permease, MFS family [Bradyrhizobium lablabi]